MAKLTIQQFGATIKQKYPQYANFSDYEIGQKTIQKYPQYNEKVNFSFDVPDVNIESREQKLARFKAEAAQAEAESKKANSVFGKAANFGKALVTNLMPSEVGLGKSIAAMDGNARDNYLKSLTQTQSQQADLLKQIRQNEEAGKDATKLKQIYNSNISQINKLQDSLGETTSNLPSTGGVLGQIGGTALDILTAGTYGKAKTAGMGTFKLAPSTSSLVTKTATGVGLPELSKISEQKASGLFTKPGAINVLKGAGIGYANDVTLGAQGLRGEDRTGGKAFIPGLSTVIGTTIPLVTETTKSIQNFRDPEYKAARLIEKRAKELNQLDSYQGIKKTVLKGQERGIDIKKVLSETDVLHGSVDKTGTISTKGTGGAVEQYTKQYIDGNEAIVGDILKKENRAVSPALVEARLRKAIMDSGIQGKALTNAKNAIKDEVAGYMLRADANGNIPVEVLHNAKIDKYNNINFFTEGNIKQYDKTVAKALKNMVQDNTKSVDVQKINEELSKHFSVIDYLNKLDGKKVSGGKLGKYFAQTVGAVVGGHLGPLGSVAGAELGGRLKGESMARSFSGKTGRVLPTSDVMMEATKVRDAAPLQLPQSKSNNFGSLNTNQSNTIIPTNNGIPDIIPQSGNKINDTINTLKTSGRDLDRAIESGDISLDKVYKDTVGHLQPSRVTQAIDDLSQKLNMYSKGLGDKFKSIVNKENPTPTNLENQAVDFLKNNKGNIKADILAKITAGTTIGLGVFNKLKNSSSITTYKSPEDKTGFLKNKTLDKDKLSNALLALESSYGKNKNSADKGELKWLTGLTPVAIKELKRLGVKDSVDINNKEDVIDASVKYFQLLQKRNPKLTPAEVYVNKYWTQAKTEKQKQDKMKKFNELISKYNG